MRRKKKLTSNQIINQLDELKDEALAMVYANPLIEQECIEGRADIRRKLLKWTTGHLPIIVEAICTYRKKRVNNLYPNPYNHARWGEHLKGGKYANDTKATYEKHIARGLFFWQCKNDYTRIPLHGKYSTRSIGTIQDYEVPLFYTGKKDGGRKIDLVSTRPGPDELIILELKNNRSTETILRCLLEAFTYSLLIDRARAKESFGVSQKAKVIICPLIFQGTAPYNDLLFNIDQDAQLFDPLIASMKKLGNVDVRFAVLDEKDWHLADGTVVFPPAPDGKTTFKTEWLQPN